MENTTHTTYDTIIIGGGPAGAAAAVYAARKQLATAIITPEFGGQSVVSETIYNWIGTPEISGGDLAKSLKTHTEYYKGEFLDIHNTTVELVTKNETGFTVKTPKGEFMTKTILVATGSVRRRLDVPGADQFEHKGVTYCASCDGPLFSGMDVVVIGGGNAGFESAAQLSAYCKTVTLLNRGEIFRADEITVEKVSAMPNVTIMTNTVPVSVTGEKFVSGLEINNTVSGETTTLPAAGIFVEIGQIPNTGYVADLVETNETNNIIIDPWRQSTSVPGIWAAGDCTNILYHQNNIAAGDAVKAIEDMYQWIKTR